MNAFVIIGISAAVGGMVAGGTGAVTAGFFASLFGMTRSIVRQADTKESDEESVDTETSEDNPSDTDTLDPPTQDDTNSEDISTRNNAEVPHALDIPYGLNTPLFEKNEKITKDQIAQREITNTNKKEIIEHHASSSTNQSSNVPDIDGINSQLLGNFRINSLGMYADNDLGPSQTVPASVNTKQIPAKTNYLDVVVIDENKTGLGIIPAKNSNMYIDLDNDGKRERIAWTNDRVLFHDPKDQYGTGGIKGFTEVKKEHVELSMHDLQNLDSNKDDHFGYSDKEYKNFKVFHDANQNGQIDKGELSYLQKDIYGVSQDKSLNSSLGDGTLLNHVFNSRIYQLSFATEGLDTKQLLFKQNSFPKLESKYISVDEAKRQYGSRFVGKIESYFQMIQQRAKKQYGFDENIKLVFDTTNIDGASAFIRNNKQRYIAIKQGELYSQNHKNRFIGFFTNQEENMKQIRYAITHEMGHHILNHMEIGYDRDITSLSLLNRKNTKTGSLTLSRQNELEADAVGYNLSQNKKEYILASYKFNKGDKWDDYFEFQQTHPHPTHRMSSILTQHNPTLRPNQLIFGNQGRTVYTPMTSTERLMLAYTSILESSGTPVKGEKRPDLILMDKNHTKILQNGYTIEMFKDGKNEINTSFVPEWRQKSLRAAMQIIPDDLVVEYSSKFKTNIVQWGNYEFLDANLHQIETVKPPKYDTIVFKYLSQDNQNVLPQPKSQGVVDIRDLVPELKKKKRKNHVKR